MRPFSLIIALFACIALAACHHATTPIVTPDPVDSVFYRKYIIDKIITTRGGPHYDSVTHNLLGYWQDTISVTATSINTDVYIWPRKVILCNNDSFKLINGQYFYLDGNEHRIIASDDSLLISNIYYFTPHYDANYKVGHRVL